MPFNLLLLPLLGGFIFVRNWKRSRYFALRSDGHVLLFYSAVAGAVFLLLATIITFVLDIPKLHDLWQEMVPFEHSDKAALALLLGAISWIPLNLFYDDEEEIDRVIQYRQNPLELLLRTAMGNRKLVAITTKSGKVYVGYVLSTSNPSFELDTIGIVPMISGYRDKDTKRVIFTTRYIDAYERIQEDIRTSVEINNIMDNDISEEEKEAQILNKIDTELNDFRHVIFVREIESAFIFRVDTYEKYFLDALPQD